MTTRLCGIPAPLSTVQLHASTSQSPLDIDQLFVKLEEPQLHIYCIQQNYGCIVVTACKIFNFIGQ